MKLISTNIEEIKLISPDIIKDQRGSFFESYQYEKYIPFIGDIKFIQDLPDEEIQVNTSQTNNLDVWDDGWNSENEEHEHTADAIQATIVANNDEFTNNISKTHLPKKVTYDISDDDDELNIDDM